MRFTHVSGAKIILLDTPPLTDSFSVSAVLDNIEDWRNSRQCKALFGGFIFLHNIHQSPPSTDWAIPLKERVNSLREEMSIRGLHVTFVCSNVNVPPKYAKCPNQAPLVRNYIDLFQKQSCWKYIWQDSCQKPTKVYKWLISSVYYDKQMSAAKAAMTRTINRTRKTLQLYRVVNQFDADLSRLQLQNEDAHSSLEAKINDGVYCLIILTI